MHSCKAFLEYKAYCLRVDSLKATTQAGSGHLTSCLSAADIMATLFFHTMRPCDTFILSKGHAAPILYAVYKEFDLITEDDLLTLRNFDSSLEGHPTPRFPYVQFATGSLGQGLSLGLGQALGSQLRQETANHYVLMGDSEITEGSIWEAAELATYYRTGSLIGIIDCNRLGQCTATIEGHNVDRYAQKFAAFGWHTITVNGHSIEELIAAFKKAQQTTDKPTMIIAATYKGYGISHLENHEGFHGKALKAEELQGALTELAQRFPEAASYHKDVREEIPAPELPKKYTYAPVTLPTPDYKLGQLVATRYAYGQALAALGKVSDTVVVFDAEVKNSTYSELFEKEFPGRFFQSFIAEQNMIGMAQGITSYGYTPFASTFGAFLTRAHDQLRMAAIGKNPLRVAGSHAGVSIGEDGPSQMALEDIALFRTLPESIILYPCDAVSAYKCTELMANHHTSISYLRTTRSATPVIYKEQEEFSLGGSKILRQSNNDVACIVTAGITVFEALKAYEILKKENILIALIDCYSIKPLDKETICSLARSARNNLVIIEDHYAAGGLGEAVLAAVCNEKLSVIHKAVTKLPQSGKTEELFHYEEIDTTAIIATIKTLINRT